MKLCSSAHIVDQRSNSFSKVGGAGAWKIKSLGPGCAAERREHVAEGGSSLASVPRVHGTTGTAQPLSGFDIPEHDEGVGPKSHRRGSLDGVLGAILRVLEAELPFAFMEGVFQR